MNFPILTAEQKRDLFERPDHGVTPAPLAHFDTYESWLKRPSSATHNLGYYNSLGKERSIYDGFREFQCFQRFALLHPDLLEELAQRVNALPSGTWPDDTTERLLWDAYEKMASLADINDAGLNGEDLPIGQIDPNSLLI